MKEQNKRVLGMYDIRGKQEFIFRSRSLKEIMGGSAVIRDCFTDYLYPAAEKLFDNKRGICHTEEAFSPEGFEKHLEQGYIGELIYDGGGNFLLLMQDEETFKEVTYAFTRNVLEEIGTLRVLGTCVEIENFEDFEGDRKRLYEKHRINEYQENGVMPWGTLPMVQVDPGTSFPLTDLRWNEEGKREKVSRESWIKYEKCRRELEGLSEEERKKLILDNLITEKGRDSLLAVVYIDGNNMGFKVQEACKGKRTYEECVAALRKLSMEIQKKYIDDRMKELTQSRLVVGAGDEINIICNAHKAFEIAVTYLKNLPEGDTSCAGIAIFHSHAPYSDVYRIAEECCESGKKSMKKYGLKDVSLLDFHYCQGAIDISLEQIRKAEGEEDISRPWLITGTLENQEIETLTVVNRVKDFLNQLGRSNVKGLAAAAKTSQAELEQELNRIHAHLSDRKKDEIKQDWEFISQLEPKRRRRVLYDVVHVYDLWFAGKEEEAEHAENRNH
ncbi:MAG: hypothetical protein Q4B85_02015 [Lachnospiraceae bacterium]|nr:hypothetical protein [Lachnospiraceae bacterium]